MSKSYTGPKILVVDLETAPILAYVWALFDQNVSLEQIKKQWFILSWSAKWLESEDKSIVYGPHRDMMYMDQSKCKNIENDKHIVKQLHKLFNEADIIVGQNSKRFDVKKANARFIKYKMKPPSPYKQMDTLQIAKKHFSFTSNKLENLTEELCVKYKKSKHKKFAGFSMWKECLNGNLEAWKEMRKYNPMDVLSTEELFHILAPWDQSINYNLYTLENSEITCNCGNSKLQRRGYAYTTNGKYQRFQCVSCGTWSRGNKNLVTKDRRDLFNKKIT